MSEPSWEIETQGPTRRAILTGEWTLFLKGRDRARFEHELSALGKPDDLTWDLSKLEALDGAGAWLLWTVWQHEIPSALECSDNHRHWFDHLQSTERTGTAGRRLGVGRMLESLGARIAAVMRDVFGLLALLAGVVGDILRCIINPPLTPWREMSASVYRTGVSSLILLGVTGYVIGVVMSLQIGVTLSDFGANARIIGLMGLAVLRELGPVIAALIQAGRAGSAITAGIAGMHLTEELDALRTFGSSPRLRLVMPKVVAMLFTMPLLVVWTDFTEIMGGATTAQLDLGVPFGLFLERLPHEVSLFNFWLGLAKGALFGIIISIVGSYFGLKARPSTDSLSAQTTKSVVVGLSLILISDALFGAILAKLGYL